MFKEWLVTVVASVNVGEGASPLTKAGSMLSLENNLRFFLFGFDREFNMQLMPSTTASCNLGPLRAGSLPLI